MLFAVPTAHAGAPPPVELGALVLEDLPLHLELVLNQVQTGQLIEVHERTGRLFVSIDQLKLAGVAPPDDASGELALDQVPGLRAVYDRTSLRLLLDVPSSWLPGQAIGGEPRAARTRATSSLGAVFNYDVYLNDTDGAGSHVAAWNELRVFGPAGSLSSTGQFRRRFGTGGLAGSGSHYRRYDTRWRYSDEDRLLTYEAGDLLSDALPWSRSVRLGGVQLSRDFSVRPDLVTYPLPQFSGTTAVPTAVELFVNGYRATSAQLQPGPYVMTNIPMINGAGEAVVVTTDALGRQVSTTLPFYVTSRLLQPGLADFSVAAGSLRKAYGERNFSYGAAVASTSLRYGVSEFLTLEGHAEAAPGLQLGGAGATVRVANLGVVNAALSHSRLEGVSGQQLSLGYQYNAPRYSLAYQRQQRQSGYADLGTIEQPEGRPSRRSQQASGSLRLGSWGNAGLGYFDILGADASRTRVFNLSWNRPVYRDSMFYLSGNRDMEGGSWSFFAQLMVSFGERGNASFGAERDRSGSDLQRFNLSRAVPTDGGFGYNLGYVNASKDQYQGDVTWRNEVVQLQAGTYGDSAARSRWADVSGSAIVMDGRLFAGNRIQDAFVVVSTAGVAGVPVRYENQPVGVTGRSGHLLVPWTSAYYAGKYEIDPMNLPVDVHTPQVEKRVMVRRDAGYLLTFPVRRSVSSSVVLVDAQGNVLPIGARVLHRESGLSTVVGWDGVVYLEQAAAHNHLQVRLPDDRSCQADFALDGEALLVQRAEPLVCR